MKDIVILILITVVVVLLYSLGIDCKKCNDLEVKCYNLKIKCKAQQTIQADQIKLSKKLEELERIIK